MGQRTSSWNNKMSGNVFINKLESVSRASAYNFPRNVARDILDVCSDVKESVLMSVFNYLTMPSLQWGKVYTFLSS